MTVGELITKLRAFDPERVVVVSHDICEPVGTRNLNLEYELEIRDAYDYENRVVLDADGDAK